MLVRSRVQHRLIDFRHGSLPGGPACRYHCHALRSSSHATPRAVGDRSAQQPPSPILPTGSRGMLVGGKDRMPKRQPAGDAPHLGPRIGDVQSSSASRPLCWHRLAASSLAIIWRPVGAEHAGAPPPSCVAVCSVLMYRQCHGTLGRASNYPNSAIRTQDEAQHDTRCARAHATVACHSAAETSGHPAPGIGAPCCTERQAVCCSSPLRLCRYPATPPARDAFVRNR